MEKNAKIKKSNSGVLEMQSLYGNAFDTEMLKPLHS